MRHLALRSLLALFACLHAGLSHADLWGHVDAKGVAHFANTQLDARYELFMKGDVGAGESGATESASRAVAVPTAPKRLLAFFDVSTNYKAVRPIMRQMSDRHQLEYELLKAVIATESGFDPKALSPRGAVGLMQLTPVTAQRFGFAAEPKGTFNQRLTDPQINISIGTEYLAHLLKRFQGDVSLALAAYNSGEGSVMRAGNQVPDIAETRNFVQTVLHLYQVLKPPTTDHKTSKSRITVMKPAQTGTGLPSARANMPVSLAKPAETDWY
jgi:soluble lytic murein transglycosylase-like protein